MKHLIQQNKNDQAFDLYGLLQSTLKKGVLLLLLIISMQWAEGQIRAKGFGSWNNPTTWDGNIVPVAADDVIIGSDLIVTIDSAGATCNNLQIGDNDVTGLTGGILFSGTTGYLTVEGTITMGSFDWLTTGTINMGGVGDAGTLECGSIVDSDIGSGIYTNTSLYGTFIFNQTSTLPAPLVSFNNLIVKGGVLTEGGANLSIEGNLSILNGATLDLVSRSAQRNSIGGTLTVENNATLKIAGGGTIPANYATHVFGATSTVEYYGTDQTVTFLNSSQNYGHLIISGTAGSVSSVNGIINIAGNLTINSGTYNISTFASDRIASGGTLTVADGGTLRIQGAGTLPANFSTHSIGANSTIEYIGTSPQDVAFLNSGQNYGNLTVTNQTKTLLGNTRVRGTLTFGGVATNRLVIGSNTLTLDGVIGGNSVAGGRNFTGSATSNLVLNGAFDRTIFFNSTTAGTTNALNNFTINHNGNVATLGNNMFVNSALIFTAGKLAIASATLTVRGNITNTVTGGIRGSTASNLIFNGSVSPTLSMDQTSTATRTLSTLQVNSSGQVVTMGNDLIMNSTTTFTAGKLAINGNTLTLRGSVTNTVTGGLRSSSTSNLVMNGTVSPTLSFDQTTPGTTNVINNVTLSGAQTVTLSNALRLLGTHTPTAGVFASGGNYTIASTASSTANIAAGSTSGGYITGDVVIERFIPMNTFRAWRLLAAPANGKTIKETWQENQGTALDGVPGFGTAITSSLAAPAWTNNGFDYKTPKNSLLAYNATTDAFTGISNTNVSIAAEPGYFIYIRGNRIASPSAIITGNNSTTTLRITGTLNNGNQTPSSVSADKFALIGNPYASAINLRNVVAAGGSAGTSYYVWDPKLAGSYNLGAFQTLTLSGGNYIIVPGGGSYGGTGSIVNNIESGAAFFVTATSTAGTVTINEASKAAGSNMVFRPGSTATEKNLITNLFAVTANGKSLSDGNIVFFGDEYSNDVDGVDSRKNSTFGENLSIIRNSKELVAERRKIPAANDTIQFSMYYLKNIPYELQILGDQLHQSNMLAFLEDKFLNTSTPINLDDTTNYSFTVTANVATKAADRFRIVFKPIIVLPVSFTNIKATLQNAKVTVEWGVSNQTNIKEYVVEKSLNSRQFAAIGSKSATGNNGSSQVYSFLDNTPAIGVSYYRIKSVDLSGAFKYTSIVKMVSGKKLPTILVSPNPIEGNVINLQFGNQPSGRYSVKLISTTGQTVYSNIRNHAGGSATQILELPSTVSGGAYQLEIIAPDNSRQVQKLLIKQ